MNDQITRASYYIPRTVKKAVQSMRANDERATPPSETACYIAMLERGLQDFTVSAIGATGGIFRIDKESPAFVICGLRLPATLHQQMLDAAALVPSIVQEGREKTTFRYIDLAACFFSRYVETLNINNL